MDADVIVVGAGLAGLRCAVSLTDCGYQVLVFEAGDAVGGRIRSESHDGFVVDRGFQVLNPAYPAVRRWIDVDALRLRRFDAGLVAATESGRMTLGHPLRAPRLLASTAGAVLRRPREATGPLRWAAPVLGPHLGSSVLQVVERRPDVSRRAAFDAAGMRGSVRRAVEAFLAGVVLEDDGSTSDRFALLLTAAFARGVPSLPAGGMQRLPDQLAERLGPAVRLGRRVTHVTAQTAGTDSAVWTARKVVVATGAAAAHQLTGLPVPATKGVVTVWWAA